MDPMLGGKPGPQFFKRRIGHSRDTGAQDLVIWGEHRQGTVSLRPHGRLTRRPAAAKSLVNVGNTDLEQGRDLIGIAAFIHSRNHTLTQILRISPAHRDPRAESNSTLNHIPKPKGIPPIPPNGKPL